MNLKRIARTLGPIVLFAAIWSAWFAWYRFTTQVILHQTKYPGGQVQEEGPVRRQPDGEYKPHGLWVEYYADGAKKAEHRYDNGVLSGVQTEWDERGVKTREEEWRSGQRVRVMAKPPATQPVT